MVGPIYVLLFEFEVSWMFLYVLHCWLLLNVFVVESLMSLGCVLKPFDDFLVIFFMSNGRFGVR